MKVLFLDIDGVLNSSRSCVANRGYPHEVTGFHREMFDDISIKLIRGLCAKGGISVVISSAWRTTHNWDLIGRGLELPTIGQTPSLPDVRGAEIAKWLAEHPEVTEWAILDDDNDMLDGQQSRFVKTDGHEGLSWRNFMQLCEIFSVNVHDCAPTRIRENGNHKLIWEDA